jgi:hypothetical protein
MVPSSATSNAVNADSIHTLGCDKYRYGSMFFVLLMPAECTPVRLLTVITSRSVLNE